MKRFLSSIMAIAIIISTVFALPLSAKANNQYTYNTINDTVVYSYSPDYDLTLNVFGRPECFNTESFLEGIKELNAISTFNMKINFIDMDNNSKRKVAAYANQISCSGVSYCYDETYYSSNSVWEMADEFGGIDDYTFPFVAYCDKNGRLVNFTTGYRSTNEIKNYIENYFGVDFNLNEQNTMTLKNVKHCQTEARSMLSMINSFRKSSDAWYWNEDNNTKVYPKSPLADLQYDYELEKAAITRAEEIAYYYSHTRPNNQLFYSAYSGSMYTCGENIAYGYGSAEAVFEAWREDDFDYSGQGHRRNMLDSEFTAVAFGCVYYNGVYYWVQEFRKPTSSMSATSADNSTSDAKIKIVGKERHNYSDISIVETSTCSKTGKKKFKCINCDDFYIEDLKKTDHKIVTVPGFAETCKTDGKTEGSYCSVCGEVIAEQQTIPASAEAHKWDYGTTIMPTCADYGYTKYTCTECGDYYYSDYRMPVDHHYIIKTTAPTCMEFGFTEFICTECGDSYIYDFEFPTDHQLKSVTKNGRFEIKCTICGEVMLSQSLSMPKLSTTTLTKVTSPKSKQIKVTWKKATQVTGYEIQYSTDKNFKKNNKTVKVKKRSTTSTTIKKLKGKKKYYVRIRTYLTDGGVTYASSWSKAKTITTKK